MTEEEFLLKYGQTSIDDPAVKESCHLLVSVRLYAQLMHVHRHTVLNWIRRGRIPYQTQQHGQYVRYRIPINARPKYGRDEPGQNN